jgi:VCBS repeat-containing protein
MANSAAIIGAPTVSDVTEDTSLHLLTATGSISIGDEAAFKMKTTSTSGNLELFTIVANGSYTDSVANTAIQHFKEEKTRVDAFAVMSLDCRRQQYGKVIFSEAGFGNSRSRHHH